MSKSSGYVARYVPRYVPGRSTAAYVPGGRNDGGDDEPSEPTRIVHKLVTDDRSGITTDDGVRVTWGN